MDGLRSGPSRVLIAVAADGAMLGGAVGDYFPLSNVMLLSYLAVLADGRGQGVGAAVLRAAKEAWTEELSRGLSSWRWRTRASSRARRRSVTQRPACAFTSGTACARCRCHICSPPSARTRAGCRA